MSNGEQPVEVTEDALPEQDAPSSAPADASAPDAEGRVPEAEASAAGDDVAADLDELGKAVAERDEYLDALRRTQADFENYRKRVQREMSEARAAGAAGLVSKLVDVLDTVDLALAHDPSDSVAQISTSLLDVLGKEGLARIDALGVRFDPEVHDAVLHEEGDGAAEVIEVLRSGWTWNGRVLRAAMVKVKGS